MTDVEIAVGVMVILVGSAVAIGSGVARWIHEPEPVAIESNPTEPSEDGEVKKLRTFTTRWLVLLLLIAPSLFGQTDPMPIGNCIKGTTCSEPDRRKYPKMEHPSVCGGEGASCAVQKAICSSCEATAPNSIKPITGAPVSVTYGTLLGSNDLKASASPYTDDSLGSAFAIANQFQAPVEDSDGSLILPSNYSCTPIKDHWVCKPDPDPWTEQDNQE